MSDSFFELFDLPEPVVNLKVGSTKHGTHMGTVMLALEPELVPLNPDWVITLGDSNSSAAAGLASVKLGFPTAHVEAGLRANDRSYPDEVNRVVLDSVCNALFVTEESGVDNLRREGIADDRIHFVGNVMIDTLTQLLPRAKEGRAWEHFSLDEKGYMLVTLHYPFNVDKQESLNGIAECLLQASDKVPVVFPVHPRTRENLRRWGIWDTLSTANNIYLTEPLDYLTFISLQAGAQAVVTDSGGVQEETTWLGVPCFTIRPYTERPVTITQGTNELIESRPEAFISALDKVQKGEWKKGEIPSLWDGKASQRILEILLNSRKKG